MTSPKTHRPSLTSEMTAFPYVIDVESPLEDADAMMKEHGIRHLPVVHDGELAGVVNHHQVSSAARDGQVTTVGDVYDAHGYVVSMDVDLAVVCTEMAKRGLNAAIVMRQGKLVGIFTASDACHTLANVLRSQFPRPDDDQIA